MSIYLSRAIASDPNIARSYQGPADGMTCLVWQDYQNRQPVGFPESITQNSMHTWQNNLGNNTMQNCSVLHMRNSYKFKRSPVESQFCTFSASFQGGSNPFVYYDLSKPLNYITVELMNATGNSEIITLETTSLGLLTYGAPSPVRNGDFVRDVKFNGNTVGQVIIRYDARASAANNGGLTAAVEVILPDTLVDIYDIYGVRVGISATSFTL